VRLSKTSASFCKPHSYAATLIAALEATDCVVSPIMSPKSIGSSNFYR
jgi:hypothetical protein